MSEIITLTALGDVAVVRGFQERILKAPLEEVFDREIIALLHRSNAVLANIECVLTESDAFAVPGYGLRCPPAVAPRLRELGITIGGLANNHIRDVGCQGVNDTIANLSEAGIVPCGAGTDLHGASQPLIFQAGGVKLGILAVAEREFNLATASRAGAAPFEPLVWGEEIQALRKRCDVTLVFLHAGHEFASVPSPRVRAACRAAVEAGAHAVIAHHPHVMQGIEVHRGAPIFYSLGNFCFDSPYVASYDGWDSAFLVEMQLSRSGVEGYHVHPIRIETGRAVHLLRGAEREASIGVLNGLSRLLEDDAAWRHAWLEHVRWRAERDYLPMFRNLEERLRTGIEPNLPRILRNYFQCPTHQELLETYFVSQTASGVIS